MWAIRGGPPNRSIIKYIYRETRSAEFLALYLLYGEIYIDNNYVENAIRPFVLGRKNWLFSNSPLGAHASAFWFSLIETARANNVEPYKFLCDFLKKLPSAKSSEETKIIFFEAMGWS